MALALKYGAMRLSTALTLKYKTAEVRSNTEVRVQLLASVDFGDSAVLVRQCQYLCNSALLQR